MAVRSVLRVRILLCDNISAQSRSLQPHNNPQEVKSKMVKDFSYLQRSRMFVIRIPEFNLNGNVSGLPRDKKYTIQIF